MPTRFSVRDFPPAEGTRVRIAEGDSVLTLDYDGAVSAHAGTLWWGAAVGYRAMQAAALALSDDGLWCREDLYLVSGHPGPGVLDALDYVTGCRRRERLKVLENPRCSGMCNAEMKFEWWVCDGSRTAAVKLRDDFVPPSFYQLTERLFGQVSDEDKRLFELFKVTLSARIWNGALSDNFSVTMEEAVAPGDIPKTTDWHPEAGLTEASA